MDEIKKQIVDEIHRSARKNFTRRKTDMVGISDTYQIDLVEMIPHARENRNFKYILTAIDIFSKFAWPVPIKTKSGKDVTYAMNTILCNGNVPKNIHSDMGKEFYNSHFQKLMRDHGINHYSTYSVKKTAIVERFNRTLKTKMWKRLHYNGSYKWIDMLQDIVHTYNNTMHRTIKMNPSDVDKQNEQLLLRTVYLYENTLSIIPKYKIGDSVRISKYKRVFEKGYEPKWTTEIFTIIKVQYTEPITYLLRDYKENDIKGAFYEMELQTVKHPNAYLVEKCLKIRGNKAFVKWLGFDSSHNSWIEFSQT